MLVSKGVVNANFQDFSAWLFDRQKSLLTSEMDETTFHRAAPAARLRVTGSDAATFLQGQFSNDLRRTEERPATYGLWLNHKGRLLADSHVLQHGPNEFEIVSRTSPATVIRQRLESYIIADDVAVEDVTAGCAGVVLIGSGACAIASAVGFRDLRRGGFAEVGEKLLLPARCDTAASWFILGSDVAIASVVDELRRLGVPEAHVAMLDRARIAAGIPVVPDELGPEDLPMEGGLEHDAISFTKGCYLGQEVMARLHNLGQVRRRLFVVAFEARAGLPPKGTALFSNAQKVGEIRAAVAADDRGGAIGLAMLQSHAVQAGAGLGLDPSGSAWIRVERLAEGRAP